ncbi:MAG: FGGY-family carbohydrate kinase, partial [candidate division NC10 bacterium]|nr:FGGY-family carbohydrate kinase [candidate division NC10 bacterium]
AFLEGVAFAARDNFETFEGILKRKIGQVRMSGGGSRSRLWQEITADVLQKEIAVMEIPDTETFGNALLAGYGAGLYSDIRNISKELAKVSVRIQPNPAHEMIYSHLHHLYQQIYLHLQEDFRALMQIDPVSKEAISLSGGSTSP